MAPGRGAAQDEAQTQFDDSGYLSDESEFYGDEAIIHDLHVRANNFSAATWWSNKIPSLAEMAISNMSKAVEKKEAALYNPYEGLRYAWQLGETVEDFLRRLPPATTQESSLTPWIFVANPYLKAPTRTSGETSQRKVTDEGPPEEDSDWAQFVTVAGHLLEELAGIRREFERKMEGKTKGVITKAVNPEKEKIVRRILDTAIDLHCTSGKWMLFCPPSEVNAVWKVVARATAENDLGIAAKVAPENPGDPTAYRLICVYTRDFSDMGDVYRVVRKMKEIGLIDTRERPIYYKCDAYTHLGLKGDNQYGIKASLYDSAKVLDKTQRVEGLFYRKKDSGDWRQLEWQ